MNQTTKKCIVWYSDFWESYFWDELRHPWSFTDDSIPILYTDSNEVAKKVAQDLNKTLTD